MDLDKALAIAALLTPESLDRFRAQIEPAWIESALEATGTATLRRRRLPADQVVWLVIGMALMRNLPILDVVDRLDLALPGDRPVAPSAVFQARSRLGQDPLEWLFGRTAHQWAHLSADRDRWRGLALYSGDGTTLRVPDSDENRAHFGGQPAGAAGRGPSGYPQTRMVVLLALRSHLIADASFGPYADERRYADEVWKSLPSRSLTIVDRLYFSATTLIPIHRDGHERHWLTRVRKGTVWKVLEQRGKGDALVELAVSQHARNVDPTLPETWQARVIDYRRPGHEPQQLITSMLDGELYPAPEIAALYHERWEIELSYDELKTEMLESEQAIRSRTVAGVYQEIWGLLVGFNLVRLEMQRIADALKVPPTRISFVAALRYMREIWVWFCGTRTPGAIPGHLKRMQERISRFLLPERRSERVYPRAVKVKMSNYELKRPLK